VGALRFNSTILEQHAVIKLFGGEEGVKPTDFRHRILAQYGSINSRRQRKVYEWVEMLKSGRTSIV
jgi:hypothetical protein